MYKFIKPHIFVSSKDEAGAITTASAKAGAFLDDLANDGIEPVGVMAHGTDARLVVSGGQNENAWILFRTTASKGAKK